MQIRSAMMSGTYKSSSAILTGVASVAAVLLSGCATGGSSFGGAGTGTSVTGHLTGSVFGGQQPVNGATVQLYAVGTSGNGSVATALIGTSVKSNSGGQFSLSPGGVPLYSCTSATQVYLVATGGDAGAGNNAALSMIAALGPCSALTTSTFIQVNELTTVAAAYALAPFATDLTHVGGSGANAPGLVNAFHSAGLLVSTATGASPAPPAGVTLPTTRLNTLADIIAACINSSGASAGCTTLFGATGASDTFGAALAMAKNPGDPAVTALWTLAVPSSPFMPTLSAQPNDLTLSVSYSGAELLSPYGIALDTNGNAWVTNEAGQSVVKLPSLATTFVSATYSGGGLLAPRGISIDNGGNVWIANTGANNVVKLNSAGTPVSGAGYAGGGVAAPVAIANDATGNAWVANFNGNSVTKFNSAGTASGGSPLTGAGVLSAPSSIALDISGRVSVANSGTGDLCIFAAAGTLQGCTNDGLLFAPTAIAANSGGNVTLAGTTTGTVVAGAFTLATNDGVVNAASPATGGGLAMPLAVAHDGSGAAWFANASSISEFSGTTALSPATGFGALNTPAGIAIDQSGNVWTANSGDNSVTVFVGLATPALTPLAANLVGP